MDNKGTHIAYKGIFSQKECNYIIALYNKKEILQPAKVKGGTILRRDIRNVESFDIIRNEDNDWIFRRLLLCLRTVNKHYKFTLDYHAVDKVGFLKYSEGSFYKNHTDTGVGKQQNRRISLVVQLTNPSQYRGGKLEFFPGNIMAESEQGCVLLFPSYLEHGVTDVIWGERFALVLWALKKEETI